jgi:hypothetical protein
VEERTDNYNKQESRRRKEQTIITNKRVGGGKNRQL